MLHLKNACIHASTIHEFESIARYIVPQGQYEMRIIQELTSLTGPNYWYGSNSLPDALEGLQQEDTHPRMMRRGSEAVVQSSGFQRYVAFFSFLLQLHRAALNPRRGPFFPPAAIWFVPLLQRAPPFTPAASGWQQLLDTLLGDIDVAAVGYPGSGDPLLSDLHLWPPRCRPHRNQAPVASFTFDPTSPRAGWKSLRDILLPEGIGDWRKQPRTTEVLGHHAMRDSAKIAWRLRVFCRGTCK